MKNVHLIPTENFNKMPYQIWRKKDGGLWRPTKEVPINSNLYGKINIYITSDEDIKEGDWYLYGNQINKRIRKNPKAEYTYPSYQKIILTTDQDLIAEGVQAIDDEFLEWFVKNPSCESVEIENKKVLVGWEPDYTYEDLGIDGSKNVYHNFYKIIIPKEEPKQELPQLGTKEFNDLASAYFGGKLNHLASAYFGGEPKQETLEEAAEKLYLSHENNELLYGHSEDLQLAYKAGILDGAKWQSERMYSEEEVKEILMKTDRFLRADLDLWFEQFKKK